MSKKIYDLLIKKSKLEPKVIRRNLQPKCWSYSQWAKLRDGTGFNLRQYSNIKEAFDLSSKDMDEILTEYCESFQNV